MVRVGVGIGLTEGEVRAAIGALVETKAMTSIRGHRRGTLLLLGAPGTGKTLAAARWLVAPAMNPARWQHDTGSLWYLPYAPARFVTARSLAHVKQYEAGSMDRLLGPACLVVDDLGQEYLDKAGFLASLVDHLVTERHRRDLATIITANLSVQEYTERYGDRSMSRILGTGGVVVCDGPDLRRGTKAARTLPGIDWAAVDERRRLFEARALIETRVVA